MRHKGCNNGFVIIRKISVEAVGPFGKYGDAPRRTLKLNLRCSTDFITGCNLCYYMTWQKDDAHQVVKHVSINLGKSSWY